MVRCKATSLPGWEWKLEGGGNYMSQAPKDIIKASELIKSAWKKYAESASFGGMTLEQYTAKIKPSYDIRQQIDDLEKQLRQLIADRDLADDATNKINASVVKGIVGDVNYGDDSDLYGACGYIRKSERASGLTRKKANGVTAAKAAAASK